MSFDEELQAYLNWRKNPRKETCEVMPIKTTPAKDDRSLREICRDWAARNDPYEWF